MQSSTSSLPTLKQPSIDPRKLVMIIVLMLGAGFMMVTGFAGSEEQREVEHWQNKLNLIADSRVADVNGWLDLHFHDLGGVANNPSLQLYLTEILNTKTPVQAAPDEPAQEVFLRSLLVVTASRLGFLGNASDELKTVNANVHRPSGTGLAIIDNSGKIIVSTEGLVSMDASLAGKVADAPKGQSSLIDMFTVGDATYVGFVVPIYPIQADATANNQIGKLIGIKLVGEDLLKFLAQPGATEKSLAALLIRKEGDNVTYLAPPTTDKQVSSKFLLNTPELDAAYAIAHPGDFALKRDRLSRPVFITSRPVKNTPWTLLIKIDRNQALAESDSWRVKMECIMVLAILAIAASIVAAWWYGTSKRAMLLSLQTGRLAAHSVAQEKLLRLVTDNQPEPIFIADSKNIVRFANEKAAKFFNIASSDVVGKNLNALMGPAVANDYIEANTSALSMHKSLTRLPRRIAEGIEEGRIIRSEHIPLGHIPIDSLPFPSPGVLVVDQDVTEIVNERERRVRIHRQLIDTLVRMVDARDPHSANHSASVALVAGALATELGLEPLLIETAETAGKLMNIGKIIVPSEILTKPAALAKDEIQAVHESMQKSVALLETIDFDGPVVETLKQAPERFDGKGPLKLAGESILITARIISVTNSFIGMISPRSYRAAIDMQKATTLLLENIDTQYDRRVVVALINFVENKQGKEILSALAVKKGT